MFPGYDQKNFRKSLVLSNSSQVTTFWWGLQGKNLWFWGQGQGFHGEVTMVLSGKNIGSSGQSVHT